MWKWIRNEGHTCRGIRKAAHNAKNEVAFAGKSVDAIRVGKVVLHASHTLASANGVWFCTACGAYVTAAEGKKSSAKLLALPCKRAANAAGRTQLKRLEKGLAPKPGMQSSHAIQPVPSVRLAQLAAMHDSIAALLPAVLEKMRGKSAKRSAEEALFEVERHRQKKKQSPQILGAFREVMGGQREKKKRAAPESLGDKMVPKKRLLRKTRVEEIPPGSWRLTSQGGGKRGPSSVVAAPPKRQRRTMLREEVLQGTEAPVD